MTDPRLDEAARRIAAGDAAGARRLCGAVLEAAAGDADALFLLGSITAIEGVPAEAAILFRRSIEAGGGTPERLYNLGLALHQTGDLAGAERAFLLAILRAPRFADAHNGLAVTLAARGDLDNAIAALARAVEERPDWADARLNLATLLVAARRPAEAFAQYRTVLAGQPDRRDLVRLAGTAALTAGNPEEAETLLRQALLHAPRDPGIMNNLALALAQMGRFGEAVRLFRQAVTLKSDYADAWFGLGAALAAQGDTDAAQAAYRTVVELRGKDPGIDSNLLMIQNYRDDLTTGGLLAAHRDWGDRLLREVGPPEGGMAAPAVWRGERRLRIGYVSPDFRQHAVANFLLPLLGRHDRRRVEIVAYSNVETPDAVTDIIRRQVDGWRDIQRASDAEVAERIRADGIDVLIDLAGHTAHHRLPVFARRPAPVQATWLGYPTTTGLAAIDLRFTDAIADPPGDAAEAGYAERLVRMDGAFLCFSPIGGTPDPAPPPCLVADGVTFGSFNMLNKLTPSTAALWARVLHAVPGSRLLLKTAALADPTTRERTVALIAGHGIPAERLDLRPRVPDQRGHLDAYGLVDIALDPMPYNGTTTTCDALWMGVPVLTMVGDRHAARVGASLLTAFGRPDLIATDHDDFVRRAVFLAADRDALAGERAGARERMRGSRLCDAAAFAREFERACFEARETC